MRISRWIWSGVVAICLVPSVAAATPPPGQDSAYDEASADSLFEEASSAMERGDYQAARTKLLQSQKLDPAAGTLFNLAECEERLTNLQSAAGYWRAAIGMLAASDERRAEAEKKLRALETERIPRLTVRLAADAPAGAVVVRDGQSLGPGELGVPGPLDPGEHTVIVRAPGRSEREMKLQLSERDRKEIVVSAGEPVQPAASPATKASGTAAAAVGGGAPARDAVHPTGLFTTPGATAIGAAPEPSFLSRHRLSLVTAGASLGLLAAGVGLGLRVIDHDGELADRCALHRAGCTDIERGAVAQEGLGTNLLLGFAAAGALTTGVLFFVVEPRRGSVAPVVAAAPAGVSLTWAR